MNKLWTVVRFPAGSWSYGGKPDDPDYAECEIWQIEDSNPHAAIRKAQSRRAYQMKKKRAAESGETQ